MSTYLTRTGFRSAREERIVESLLASANGLTAKEIADDIQQNYHTVRKDIISLVDRGKIVQTSEYRNGCVYKPKKANSMPLLRSNGISLSLWDHVTEIIRLKRNAPLVAGMAYSETLILLFQYATENRNTLDDRRVLRDRLVRMYTYLTEVIDNLNILLSDDNLWGDDKYLEKALLKDPKHPVESANIPKLHNSAELLRIALQKATEK